MGNCTWTPVYALQPRAGAVGQRDTWGRGGGLLAERPSGERPTSNMRGRSGKETRGVEVGVSWPSARAADQQRAGAVGQRIRGMEVGGSWPERPSSPPACMHDTTCTEGSRTSRESGGKRYNHPRSPNAPLQDGWQVSTRLPRDLAIMGLAPKQAKHMHESRRKASEKQVWIVLSAAK